jgi:hypothetical protein
VPAAPAPEAFPAERTDVGIEIPDEITDPTGASGAGEPGGRAFSETAWFLAAEDIQSELLASEDDETAEEAVDVEIHEERYRPDGKIATEVRKRYSLDTRVQRVPDEEDD